MFTTKKILLRVASVFMASVFTWRFVLYLNNLLSGEGYSSTTHFVIALTTTILSFLLINLIRRADNISWDNLGMEDCNKNFRSFIMGIVLWLVPAIIGLGISLLAGWVELTVTTNLSQLIVSVVILFITVFLIEAFPEELINRGYIYSLINTRLPHWITLIIQTLVFSLFGFLVGAMYSYEQFQFIIGFGFMMGYFRARSGNVWTSIGFHTAIMTGTQILSPVHNHFAISGDFMIRFFAFNLVPYILASIALEYIKPNHNWQETVPISNNK